MNPRNDPVYQGDLASCLHLKHRSFYILLSQPVGSPWLDFLSSSCCPSSCTFSVSPPHSQSTARLLPGPPAQLAGTSRTAVLSCSLESPLWGTCHTQCIRHILFKPENATWMASPNKAGYPPRALRSGLLPQTKERGAFSALCAPTVDPPNCPSLALPPTVPFKCLPEKPPRV